MKWNETKWEHTFILMDNTSDTQNEQTKWVATTTAVVCLMGGAAYISSQCWSFVSKNIIHNKKFLISRKNFTFFRFSKIKSNGRSFFKVKKKWRKKVALFWERENAGDWSLKRVISFFFIYSWWWWCIFVLVCRNGECGGELTITTTAIIIKLIKRSQSF